MHTRSLADWFFCKDSKINACQKKPYKDAEKHRQAAGFAVSM